MDIPFINLDIEPTNRCNAKCYFCPRDLTPHQGLMTEEIFDQALRRAVEFEAVSTRLFERSIKLNLCGLGEPLLNKLTPSFVAKARGEGFVTSLTTNGALLDERRGRALVDAGLQGVEINVGEVGDDYEEIYGLPFEKTRDNVVRFAEMAGDSCQVRIVLVDHRHDQEHLHRMMDFWRSHGIDQFLPFEIMNRGGSLFVDHMQYDTYDERFEAEALLRARAGDPVCGVPFIFLFVGWDGQHYMCCSDWKKEAPLGSVFDRSFEDVVGDKLAHTLSREPICRTCNLDPINRLTEELRARTRGESTDAQVEALVAQLGGATTLTRSAASQIDPSTATMARPEAAVDQRRRIPVVGI